MVILLALALITYGKVNANNDNEFPEHNDYNRFSIGLSGGMISPLTNLGENPFFPDGEEITFGGRVMLNFHFSPVYTLQTSFLYGEMQGINTERNREFETDLLEVAFINRLSLNKLLNPQGRLNESVNFYGFAGAGLLAYRSRLYENDQIIRYYGYTDDGHTADDLLPEIVVPYGLGLNFKVSERFDLGIETGYRWTSSRRLDAFPDIDERKDQYNFTSINITIRLGSNTNSMDWAPLSQIMYPGDLTRINDLDRRLDAMTEDVVEQQETHQKQHETHQKQMEALHVELDGMSDETAEIMQRTVQLFGALEDIRDKVAELQAGFQHIKERPEHFYSVQVMALKEEMSPDEARESLGITNEVMVYRINDWYKYISGQYSTLEDAILHMQRIWGQGVLDAFVVEYRDGILYPR